MRRFLKTVNDAVLVMSAGKRFHRVGAATLKARLPYRQFWFVARVAVAIKIVILY